MVEIEEICDVVTQTLIDDKPKMDLYDKIDKAVNTIFDPDPEMTKLPWIKNRHYALTDIADAKNTAVRTFSTLLPDIKVQPNSNDEMEYERAEMMETVLSWEFERMNRGSVKTIHEQIVASAVTYHAVAFDTQDLAFKYKGIVKTPRINAMLRQKRFNWVMHHPKTIHVRTSDTGIESRVKVAEYTLQQLIDNFGMENEGVKKILEKNRSMKKADLIRAKYTLVDWMDWKDRAQFALAGTDLNTISKSDFVFMNEEHGLPFIPTVYVDKGDPLWKSVIVSGLWENLQYVNMIEFAKALEQSTRSTFEIATPDGTLRTVWIDPSNPSNPIVHMLDGTTIKPLPTAPIDPQLSVQRQVMQSAVSKSTVASILQDPTPFLNSPFSTFNTAITSAMGQLSQAKNCAEEAETMGHIQDLSWIKHSEIPLVGYRNSDKDSKLEGDSYKKRGSEMILTPASAPTEEEYNKMNDQERAISDKSIYYDLEYLYLKVELQSNNMADEQSRQNTLINAIDKMGLPKREAFERMGWKNFDLMESQKMQEALNDSEIANAVFLQTEEAKQQMRQQVTQEIQQQMQQQQMQQQKSQANQNKALNSGNQMSTLQGRDMRSGMNPAANVAPNEGPLQIQGQQ